MEHDMWLGLMGFEASGQESEVNPVNMVEYISLEREEAEANLT